MINSLLAHYDQSVDHLLPMWALQGNETWCMIGYHAVPVIVDGYFKGVKGFDAAARLRGHQNHRHESRLRRTWPPMRKLGWVPCDKENESVSKTLEYAYDDCCIARMAKALGKTGGLRLFHETRGQLQKHLRSVHGLDALRRIPTATGARRSIRTSSTAAPTCTTSPRRPARNTLGSCRRTCPA